MSQLLLLWFRLDDMRGFLSTHFEVMILLEPVVELVFRRYCLCIPNQTAFRIRWALAYTCAKTSNASILRQPSSITIILLKFKITNYFPLDSKISGPHNTYQAHLGRRI